MLWRQPLRSPLRRQSRKSPRSLTATQPTSQVGFNAEDTTLNGLPSSSGNSLMLLTDNGMQYLLAGARANVGVKDGSTHISAEETLPGAMPEVVPAAALNPAHRPTTVPPKSAAVCRPKASSEEDHQMQMQKFPTSAKETTYEEICAEMKKRSEGDMKGYPGYTDEEPPWKRQRAVAATAAVDTAVASEAPPSNKAAVRGVHYDPRPGRCKYQVRLENPRTRKRVHGGMFTMKAEAESRARQLAKQLEEEPAQPQLQHLEPLGPEKGIRWVASEQAWHARCQGKHMRFRPKDLARKNVQKAWKQALAWRKEQRGRE
ncbi:GAPC1 [Symbiodinium sp. CCMP2592]|nr:GAPC1 [Symbiodinium sp. CCMP2592]